MAKKLFSILVNVPKLPLVRENINQINVRGLHSEVPVKEIKIPVAWGQLSAKLWGNENEQPLLALHGWQDNAGTWDPLAPMLCQNRPILAIEFPGHGLSSWIPKGMLYYTWHLPYLILHIKEYLKWNKVAILGHSMGSIAGIRFASIFPDDMEYYIAIDSLTYDDYNLELVVDRYSVFMKKTFLDQERSSTEPPSYTLEEIPKIWNKGTNNSVSIESAKILMKRGTVKSALYPDKYYFSRDPRLKHVLFNPEDKKFVRTLVKRLKCPSLYLKADNSPYASDKYSIDIRHFIEQTNPNFQCEFVSGTHHVHLNNPEIVAPIIKSFLEKHRLK